MLVVRSAPHDAAVGGQHFDRRDCVVHETAPERRRFDADAGNGAAERD